MHPLTDRPAAPEALDLTELGPDRACQVGQPATGLFMHKPVPGDGDWCDRPGRYVARLSCGHPFVICEHHYEFLCLDSRAAQVVICCLECPTDTRALTLTWSPV